MNLQRYRPILDRCQPYLVATQDMKARLPQGPVEGLSRPLNRVDPHDEDRSAFLNLLQRLDGLTYGPRGLHMPRWVFYDCAEMVGGIFGFGRAARDLPQWVLDTLEVPASYQGLVPLSMAILIPMLGDATFLGYTLCSVNQVAPGAAPANLRLVTLTFGLRLFGARTLYGTTQWRSPTLGIYARLGPLELVTAYTPAHTVPQTLTFRLPVTPARLRGALAQGTPAGDPRARHLDADDERGLRALQRRIERGERFRVAGLPRVVGARTEVPLVQT